MTEFFAGLFTIITMIIIVLGPPAIIIFIIIKLTRKTKTKPNKKGIHQQPQAPSSNTPPQYQQATQIDEKEDIEEYYNNQYIPYRPKYFLTKNEIYVYREIKKIADDNNLVVLSKIRVADLVEVEPMDKSNWAKYFNKINKKHVDFALAKPDNLRIELLIEVDDYSHHEQQYERDKFLEAVFKKTGYKLLRIKGTGNLKEKIEETIKQK